MYQFSNIAVTPTPSKTALLFYEHALPLSVIPYYGSKLVKIFPGGEFDEKYSDQFVNYWNKSPIPKELRPVDVSVLFKRFRLDNIIEDVVVAKAAKEHGNRDLERYNLNAIMYSIFLQINGIESSAFIDSQFNNVPSHLPETLFYLPKNKEISSNNPTSLLELSMNDLLLIDEKDVCWDQIFEIKEKDKESLRDFKNFRLFWHDNYTNKPKQYIVDSIEQKFEAYETACKKHGIKREIASAKLFLNSKSFLASSAIAYASILLGEPFTAGASLLSGTALELGKLSLNYIEHRNDLKTYKDNNEIAYLIKLKEKMKKPTKPLTRTR